jgi:hypothetical protein
MMIHENIWKHVQMSKPTWGKSRWS